MTAKTSRYFWIVLLALLTACGTTSPATEMTKVQNTAVAIVQTGVALTQTAQPTATFQPSTFTPTASLTSLPPATPTPPQPIVPLLTPDAIQVERWKEYEKALAQSIFPTFPYESILCEWDILARSGQEVYVWAVCAFSKGNDWRPAVIHLGTDGSVHSVEIPKRGSPSDINRTFPEEAQAKFSFYSGDSLFNGRLKELLNHLYYRLTYPEEPPLIVLLATPMATPIP